ncbi:hypothetical protein Tco_0707354 [Tanacetum coccineum]|uniref:Uncharacterized protein n=1 Tax=Tanacetum coccineum TaxID=301880 RepID=A0ABQ4YBJ0_9ASTR
MILQSVLNLEAVGRVNLSAIESATVRPFDMQQLYRKDPLYSKKVHFSSFEVGGGKDNIIYIDLYSRRCLPDFLVKRCFLESATHAMDALDLQILLVDYIDNFIQFAVEEGGFLVPSGRCPCSYSLPPQSCTSAHKACLSDLSPNNVFQVAVLKSHFCTKGNWLLGVTSILTELDEELLNRFQGILFGVKTITGQHDRTEFQPSESLVSGVVLDEERGFQ